MEIMLISLFVAVLLPILAKIPLAVAQRKTGRYDNRNPRTQQASLAGFGARAKAAHENSFEALILFTPGVLAVVALNAATGSAQSAAILFVIARVIYLMMYWLDVHIVRSLAWILGYGASLFLILEAVLQAQAAA